MNDVILGVFVMAALLCLLFILLVTLVRQGFGFEQVLLVFVVCLLISIIGVAEIMCILRAVTP